MEGLRQSARGITGKIIIVIAIVAFVFLGSIAVLGNLSFGSVKVNGEKVTPLEISRATSDTQTRYQQFGLDENEINRIALEQVVNSKAISTTLTKMGIISSNDTIEEQIQAISAFAPGGQFDLNTFEEYLAMNFLTYEQFKKTVSGSINIQQYQQGAFATDFVTNSDAAKLYALENQSRTYQSLVIKQSDFIADVETPSEESIQLYFDTNRTNFMTDESAVVDYIKIDAATLIGEIEVSQDEIDQAYALYVEEQNAKARKTVSHILISTDERSSADAELIAKEVIEKIQSGSSFESMVNEYSDDIGSKDIGGFFGEISSDSLGDIDFKLGAATLSEVGEISAPVQTQYGFHVIRLDALTEVEIAELTEKNDELAETIKLEKFDDALNTKVDEINNSRFEVDTMDQLADLYSTEVISNVSVFREGGDSVTSNNDFKAAAFSEQNRAEQLISEAITSIDNSIVLVEIADYLPAQVKLLEEVNGEIIDILVKQKASAMAQAKASELVQMYQGAMVDDLVLEGFEESKTVTRNDATLASAVRTELFDMPKSGEKVSVTSVQNGDDQVVVVLTSVVDASVDQQSAEFIAYKQSLDSAAANVALRSFQNYVIETAVVKGL